MEIDERINELIESSKKHIDKNILFEIVNSKNIQIKDSLIDSDKNIN